ncbi:MAG: hypothetical protein H6Q59_398 [Firmicutes bacterium]|nr:hypothetical protein [Bacillota bacterium]
MYQDYEDGVIMDDTVMIIDEKRAGFPLATRIFQFLVIAIGSWAGISMLVESIGIPCNMLRVDSAILIFTALFYVFCIFPSYDLVKLFFSILIYGLFLYSRLRGILNGFYLIENLASKRISAYYGTEPVQFVADKVTADADITLFVIMFLILMVGLLSVAVIRSRLVGIGSVILFLPIAACFLLGLIPSELYLISYALCLLYLIRSEYHEHHSVNRQQKTLLHRISSRSAIWLCMTSLLLFFLMKIFVTREDYDSMTGIKQVKAEIQSAMNDFSWEDLTRRISDIQLFTRKVSSTGLNGGELGRIGQVQYENVRHLTIIAPLQSIDEGIYLKGYVGSIYTGDRWEAHSQEMQKEYEKLSQRLPQKLFPPVNQMELFLEHFVIDEEIGTETNASSGWYEYSLDQGRMKIEYRGANNKFLYAPYFTDYSVLKDIMYEQDLYAAPILRKDNYEYQYFYNVSLLDSPTFYEKLLDRLSDYTEYEKLYRDYVYRIYTQLPEEGLLNIKRDFSPERVKTKTGSITEKIEYIKEYLDRNTQYSLTPGKLPDGEDFVEYFVYQNKVGYCAHYASAATLMLRSLGVPARYVEGYAVGAESIYRNSGSQETTRYTNLGKKSTIVTQSEVNVMDYNAHAWVEVYFDNCGWIPVEFTPGSTVNYNNSVVADMEEFSDNIEDGNIKKGQEETNTIPTPVPTIPIPEQPVNLPADGLNQASTASDNNLADTLYLLAILTALLLFTVGLLFYRIRKNKQARYSSDLNRRVIFLYREIEIMFHAVRWLPGKAALLEESEAYVKEQVADDEKEDFTQLMEIVRKARFSRDCISSQELAMVQIYWEDMYIKMNLESSLLKRIYLKLILSI